MRKMNPVVHFEMGYNDKDRIRKFYEEVFGWETKQLGDEFGNYITADTTESDEKGPLKAGGINGGFYQKTEDSLSHAPSFVVQVEDIKVSMKAVEEAGGKILGSTDQSGKQSMEPQAIPGVGLWVSIMDTEGNRVSMLEPADKSRTVK
jgi:uncharacterized protein